MGCCCCCGDPMQPVNKVVMCVAFFSTIYSGILQFGLGSCTLIAVQEEFGVDYTFMALVIASSNITQIIFSLAFPQIEKRFNLTPEFLCGIGGGICFLGTLCYAVAQHASMLVLGNLINGIGAASIAVFLPSMVTRLVSHDAAGAARIPLAIAQSYAAIPLGMVFAAGTCIATNGGEGSLWRYQFALAGLLLFIPITLFFCVSHQFGKNGPEKDPRRKPLVEPTIRMVVDNVMKDKKVILTICSTTATTMVVSAFSAFLVPYGQKHLHMSGSEASMLLAGTVPSVIIGMLAGGYISSRAQFSRKQLLLFTSCSSIATFAVTLVLFPANMKNYEGTGGPNLLPVFITGVVLGMLFLFMQSGPSVAVITQLLPLHLVSYGQCLVNILTRAIGGVLGPICLGLLLDNGVHFNMAFFVISWALFLGATCALVAWCVTPPGYTDPDADPDAAVDGGNAELGNTRTASSGSARQTPSALDGSDGQRRKSASVVDDLGDGTNLTQSASETFSSPAAAAGGTTVADGERAYSTSTTMDRTGTVESDGGVASGGFPLNRGSHPYGGTPSSSRMASYEASPTAEQHVTAESRTGSANSGDAQPGRILSGEDLSTTGS